MNKYLIIIFSGTFWLYFGVCFLGMLFMCFMLPETKNKSLEQVQELFMSSEYKANYLREKEANAKQNEADDTKFWEQKLCIVYKKPKIWKT